MNAILGDFLRKQGYAVTTLTSATAALKWLQNTPAGTGPEVILSDIKLGAVSGIEMTRRLTTERPAVPVVLFSVFDQLEKESMESGARRFLKKPFPLGRLKQILFEELRIQPYGVV